MEAKEVKTVKAVKTQKPVEAWAEAKATDAATLAGMKASKGWKTGKSVTEAEYDAAVKAFRTAPADGRK